jgi:hypothetical protein
MQQGAVQRHAGRGAFWAGRGPGETENRILRKQTTGRVELSDGERTTLAEIGKKLEKKALEEVPSIVKPETILAWRRKLNVQQLNGPKHCQSPG